MKGIDLEGIRVISCDVFDTLLRRNATAEPGRVRHVAERAAAMLLRERGLLVSKEALWRARRNVQHLAYRALDMADPTGEVTFDALVQGMALSLGFGPAEAQVFARAEIEVERTQLASNTSLLTWLTRRASEGIRIIAVSDTWHTAATIRGLLDDLAEGHPIAKVYTSADLGASKRTAAIFPKVADAEDVPAGAFLHIGDDAQADERMARSAGLRPHRIFPPRLVILERRLDAARARLARKMPER